LAPPPDGRSRAHEVGDHALFVAGLVHDQVPRAAISIRPVLSRYGAGDLHLLLSVLADVIAQKPPEDRLVINMSLGFLPRLEHLARIWYGVADPNDPDFVPDVPMRGLQFDVDWLNRNRAEVDRVRDLLHSGVRRLFEYLLANNCLAVAAAGNDSLRRVESGRPRLGPRIPARYETVLGVAATVHDASRAADYSNIGDELEFGDHIATFGGGITPSDEPDGGVVGLFTAPRFPRSASRNDNGWAEWSGTSFATGIVSGLVSGYWASQSPTARAEDVLAGFHNVARRYASAVRTPSIPLAGKWQPVS
jgi:hypothetical protein